MGSLALRIISLFGRYSVLLLLPPLALAVWGWSLLLENHMWPSIILAVPLLLAVLSTMVLVLGMLLAGIRRPRGITVDRAAAPEFWSYWDTASPLTPNTRRQIIIDAEINAAMGEQLRFAGLFGRDQTLVLGLGLLILLDRPAVEAVLEHEFAHADLKHSAGLTRINEFRMTYESFHGYVEDDMPAVALFLDIVFTSFVDWLSKEHLRLSKVHELQADRQSADRVGVQTEARAQIILEGSSHVAEKMIFEPLDKEIHGALVAPAPPLDRILAKRDELTDPGNIANAVKEVLLKKPDPAADHPPLAERLTAIGAKPDMAIEPLGPPAFQTMLPQDTQEQLLNDLNKEWLEMVNDYVRLE